MDQLPDAELAHVEEQKVTGYLLAFGHRLPVIEKEVRRS